MDYSRIAQLHLEEQIKQQQLAQQQQQILQQQLLEQQYQQSLQQQQQPQQQQSQIPVEVFNIFEQATLRVFKQWTALQLALANEWGGKNTADKIEEMRQDVIDLFLVGKPVYRDQIESILDECMSQDLNTVAEDGSYREVAEIIIQCFNLAMQGQFDQIVQLVGNEEVNVLQHCTKSGSQDDDDDDDDDESDGDDSMMDDSEDNNNNSFNNNNNQKSNEPDDDGWITVPQKGRR
eukprot:gene5261-6549_t